MKTTFDAEVDAAYISLTSDSTTGRSVRTVEVESTDGSVVLDFDRDGVLLGLEILGATRVLDRSYLEMTSRVARD